MKNNGEWTVSSTYDVSKTRQLRSKRQNDHYHTQKSVQNGLDLKVRPEAIKLLEENIGSMLLDISLSNIFPDMFSLGKENKSKNKQMGLDQATNFCAGKETIRKMKDNLLNGRRYL